MSVSPPLWIMVGRPACSARIAVALFSHKVRSIPPGLFALVCGGALRAAVVPNALRKGLSGGVGMEGAEWPLLHARRHFVWISYDVDVFLLM